LCEEIEVTQKHQCGIWGFPLCISNEILMTSRHGKGNRYPDGVAQTILQRVAMDAISRGEDAYAYIANAASRQ
jgi:hypothetical protein